MILVVSPDGASPAVVAERMVDCFATVAGLERPTTEVFAAAMATIGLGRHDPVAVAGGRLAADMDCGVAGAPGNAYHNSQHTCEVMLCSLFLARQARLPAAHQGRVLLAALTHDFHHNGTTNAGQPFRLEGASIGAARPYLIRAGIDAEEIERIAALVLATDLAVGAPFARRCLLHFHPVEPARPHPLPEPPVDAVGDRSPLAWLAKDADLALQAVLLAEADVLPSVGLTDAHGTRCQRRLADENDCIIPGPAEKLAFLDAHVPPLLVARFFQPNLERQREHHRRAIAAKRTAGLPCRDGCLEEHADLPQP